jgi:tetratricopeptide (TPR) repeat protein
MSDSHQPVPSCAAWPADVGAPAARGGVLAVLLLVLLTVMGPPPAMAEDCGPVPLPGAAGPYDYVDSKFSWNLNDISQNHWVPYQREMANNRLQHALAQLYYLLVRVPNHYPGLFELGRIAQLHPGVTYVPALAGMNETLAFPATPECYFDRAFRYRPKDPTLRMLFGLYYHKIHKLQEAVVQYEKAEAMDPESSEIQYNMGLVYFDLKDYESAVSHAQKAYKLGYPLAGLRKKLVAAGKWPAGDG